MANPALAQNRTTTAKRRRGPGRPFLPGNNANPGGRPKRDRALTAALEEVVDKTKLAEKLYKLALGGDMAAIKYVYDRIEGMPPQRREIEIYNVREEAERIADELGFAVGSEERKAAIIEAERLLLEGLD